MDSKTILAQLTTLEKCRLVVGIGSWHTYPIERLGVPSLMMTDGPHGIRKEIPGQKTLGMSDSYPAVCYPPAVTIASTFDPHMAETVGQLIGQEARANNVHFVLGPGVNIKRNPLCGRNFEYFSEDPLVSGRMGEGLIRGIQSQQVGACLKHFALNNQETYRMSTSSVADSRAKREIYLKSFELALKANPAMVMCSYNAVDGTPASENAELLIKNLRETLGFQGVIVSDWTAVLDRVRSLKASLDLEMPGHEYSVKRLQKAVENGSLHLETLDASVLRLLTMISSYAEQKPLTVDYEQHHLQAADVAADGAVLLKNEGAFFPIAKADKVCLIGELARTPRIQGGGSSHIHPFRIDTLTACLPNLPFAPGYTLTGDGWDQARIEEAVQLAKTCDKAIVVIGLTDRYESEGYDRSDLNLPLGHNELVRSLVEAGINVGIVLQIGSPVIMPWQNAVKAILNGYLGGEAGANGLAKLIQGEINPSGRLAETFPTDLSALQSMPHFAKGNHDVAYQESIYVGYRYNESKPQAVLYPFGFGLSYTTFLATNLLFDKASFTPGKPLKVSVDIENTGNRFGREVIQLYVKNPTDGIFRPLRELRKIAKIGLKPGEKQTVVFLLDSDDFAFYDPISRQFIAPSGNYEIEIRKNARDGILSKAIKVKTSTPYEVDPVWKNASTYYAPDLSFSRSDFESLIGKPLGETHVHPRRPYTVDHTLEDIEHTFFGKILKKMVIKTVAKATLGLDEGSKAMVETSLSEVPVRSFAIFSNGSLKMETMMGLVELCNARFFKAIGHFVGRDRP